MKKIDLSVRADLFVILSVELLFLFIMQDKKIYDVPTAFFFTLALALLQRGQFLVYIVLFPLICLNRETAILLSLFFAIYFFHKMTAGAYLVYLASQLALYAAIRIQLLRAFAGAPGAPLVVRPLENLQMYLDAPLRSMIFLSCVGAVLVWVMIKWRRAHCFMRTAFLTFAPALVGAYFLFGVTFEYRVFLELFPVVLVIGAS